MFLGIILVLSTDKHDLPPLFSQLTQIDIQISIVVIPQLCLTQAHALPTDSMDVPCIPEWMHSLCGSRIMIKESTLINESDEVVGGLLSGCINPNKSVHDPFFPCSSTFRDGSSTFLICIDFLLLSLL